MEQITGEGVEQAPRRRGRPRTRGITTQMNVRVDKDLKVLRTHFLKANQGLDVMPEKLSGGKLLFIKAKSSRTADPKAVTCSFDFWSPAD